MENNEFKRSPFSMQLDLSKFSQESFAPATDEEKRQQDVMSESTTFFKDGIRKLFKNPLAVMSLVLLAFILLVIIIAPLIVPYRYEEMLSVNGVRQPRTRRTPSPASPRAIPASRTYSARTNSAAIISSAWSMRRGSPSS